MLPFECRRVSSRFVQLSRVWRVGGGTAFLGEIISRKINVASAGARACTHVSHPRHGDGTHEEKPVDK